MSRVKEAVDSASGKPFAKENLRRARRWLYFHGLVVCEITAESKPTLAQQIVEFLRKKASPFHMLLPDKKSTITLKGLLLLVAIADLYAIKIVVFSTRRKPVEIAPYKSRRRPTVALLRHQDSILSEGAWYPLELAKNWVKQAPTVHMISIPSMTSPAAVKRPPGTAPKRKTSADYASLDDDTLRDLLRIVM